MRFSGETPCYLSNHTPIISYQNLPDGKRKATILAVNHSSKQYLIPQERIHHDALFACCLGASPPRVYSGRRPKQSGAPLSRRREDFHRAYAGRSSSVYCGGDREKETARRHRNGKE